MSSASQPLLRSKLSYLLPASAVLLFVVLVGLFYLQHPTDEVAEELDLQLAPPGMVAIRGGKFRMGSHTGAADERPIHEVFVDSFYMDETEVTNAQYAEFVRATGYVTVAEQKPDPANYPGVPAEDLVPGSAMFRPVKTPTTGWEQESALPPWWYYLPGASWRQPEGPGSSIVDKPNYPVVHIAWVDAVAYAKWAGKRLPTEAEWEYAARGGLDQAEYTWGHHKQGHGGKWFANTFQGVFPHGDTGEDGYKGLAPVKQYPPNPFGLYDISGNVWEWCQDSYANNYYAISPRRNPTGPKSGDTERGQELKVRRGGSYLCSDDYCRRYLPNARDSNPADSGACHTGFRCVKGK